MTSPRSIVRQQQLGMLYIIASMFIFMSVNALIKECGPRYPINQILFFRFVPALFPAAIILFMEEGAKGFRTTYFSTQIGRGLLGTFGLGFMFYAFSRMPLADSIAISFSSTLFTVIFSIPLLKEYPSLKDWGAIFIGFVGILIVAKPGGDGILSFAALICILGATLDALTMSSGRLLALKGVKCGAMSFYFSLVAAVLSGISAFFWWEPIASLQDFLFLLTMGLAGGVGQYFVAKGFALAPSAIAAPMIYTAMIWSILYGYIFWGEVPSYSTLLGIFFIIAAGILVAYLSSARVQAPGRK